MYYTSHKVAFVLLLNVCLVKYLNAWLTFISLKAVVAEAGKVMPNGLQNFCGAQVAQILASIRACSCTV